MAIASEALPALCFFLLVFRVGQERRAFFLRCFEHAGPDCLASQRERASVGRPFLAYGQVRCTRPPVRWRPDCEAVGLAPASSGSSATTARAVAMITTMSLRTCMRFHSS